MFSKILIANRGEIAVRIMRACHELGIGAVLVYSQADKDAAYLKFADEAICIGPAPAAQTALPLRGGAAGISPGSPAITTWSNRPKTIRPALVCSTLVTTAAT